MFLLFHPGTNLYLFYVNRKSPGIFRSVKLTPDGFNITDGTFQDLIFINSTIPKIAASWYFRRGNLDYILFSSDTLRVARSIKSTLGPYEVQSEPVVPKLYWEPCVVKDVDNRSDIIMVEYDDNPDGIGVYAASLFWSGDNWPIIATLP